MGTDILAVDEIFDMNAIWEGHERLRERPQEADRACVIALLPSLEDGHFESELEGMEQEEEDVKEDNEKQVCHMRFIVENHTKVNNTPIQDSLA